MHFKRYIIFNLQLPVQHAARSLGGVSVLVEIGAYGGHSLKSEVPNRYVATREAIHP